MDTHKYMQLSLTIMPQEIIAQYKLDAIARNSTVYMEMWKGIPKLKQVGKIVSDRLQTHLEKYGYTPVHWTTSLWKHDKKTSYSP